VVKVFVLTRVLFLVIVVLIAAASPSLADPAKQSPQLVSVAANGSPAAGASFGADVSAHGRYVAFTSTAALAADDTNGLEDVYLRDRFVGTTRRVSVDSDAPGLFAGINPAVSDDGSVVAYIGHHATAAGANEAVFVRDLRHNTFERISADNARFCWQGGRQGPAISGNGAIVAFGCSGGLPGAPFEGQCFTENLATGVLTTLPVCGLTLGLDRTGRFVVMSTDDGNVAVLDLATNAIDKLGPGEDATMSDDGGFVAFDRVGGDVYVFDRVTRSLEDVSVSSAGVPADQQSIAPSISPDGRFVAFESSAANLVPGDDNDSIDVFLHDRARGVTVRVDVDSSGSAPPGVFSHTAFDASVSDRGRVVTFTAEVPLVPTDTNGLDDVYAYVQNGSA
jgi:Tol biopolymer transport system component